MDNSVTYSINLRVNGQKDINKLPAVINTVGETVGKISDFVNPLTKKIKLLENTNIILIEKGKVFP